MSTSPRQPLHWQPASSGVHVDRVRHRHSPLGVLVRLSLDRSRAGRRGAATAGFRPRRRQRSLERAHGVAGRRPRGAAPRTVMRLAGSCGTGGSRKRRAPAGPFCTDAWTSSVSAVGREHGRIARARSRSTGIGRVGRSQRAHLRRRAAAEASSSMPRSGAARQWMWSRATPCHIAGGVARLAGQMTEAGAECARASHATQRIRTLRIPRAPHFGASVIGCLDSEIQRASIGKLLINPQDISRQLLWPS